MPRRKQEFQSAAALAAHHAAVRAARAENARKAREALKQRVLAHGQQPTTPAPPTKVTTKRLPPTPEQRALQRTSRDPTSPWYRVPRGRLPNG